MPALTVETDPVFDRGDTRIAVAGDWHINTDWALKTIAHLKTLGIKTIYQLGDFGIWPGRDDFVLAVQDALRVADITLVVTPGNHENWQVIDEALERSGGVPFHPLDCGNIWILPKVWRFTHAGRTFLSLGGAPSVDREERAGEYVDWWPTEVLDENDVRHAIAGGASDIMLTHDAPHGAAEKVEEIAARRMDEHPMWRDYMQQGRYLLDQVYERARPRLLLHGHYHLGGVSENELGMMVSLNRDGQPFATVIVDLADDNLPVVFVDGVI